ncbi:MAG TPA: ATP-binding protein [Spirochaetota bacterium]|nr:ATP-binding protein [Spirochaetota bacterium]HPS86163.1 ATP-binding protein [Spirochaetota bacterium]
MNIAVASGKGGTGKTTISLCLASYYADKEISVALLDCDVEEPNVNLFLQSEIMGKVEAHVLIPSVDNSLCSGCGKCGEICQYSAIVLIKGKPLVLKEMCHSCGGCFLVCPEKAISEVKRTTGVIELGELNGIQYAGGRLNIGEAMSPPLIKDVKEYYSGAVIRIMDSPPGTSCPVIESVKGCDFLVLVSEPTPFGLNDLKLAAEMARAMKIPFGVVENRTSPGNNSLREFCKSESIPLIASIPDTKEIAVRYSRGDSVSYIKENYRNELDKIANHISSSVRADMT